MLYTKPSYNQFLQSALSDLEGEKQLTRKQMLFALVCLFPEACHPPSAGVELSNVIARAAFLHIHITIFMYLVPP